MQASPLADSGRKPSESRTVKDHPYFFGSYLNLARHNAYLIIADLSMRFDMPDADTLREERLEKSELLRVLSQPNHPEPHKQRRIALALVEHFPWLEKLAYRIEKKRGKPEQDGGKFETDLELSLPDIVRELRKAFMRLSQLRNEHSHYKPALKPPQGGLELEPIFEAARSGILDRFKVWLKEEHAAHLVCKRQGDVLPKYRLSKEDPKDKSYPSDGIIFFTCLFLDRKNAGLFLGGVKGYKATQEPWQRATRECFTYYCCKLPKPRLESSDILLDMLTELSRCPADLFKVLPPELQAKFITGEQASDPAENGTPAEPSEPTTMKRKKDRFSSWFALRYFDDTQAFSQLRFQLHLGKLRKKRYPKTMLGAERERLLVKDIHVFGRFGDFAEEKMPSHWKVTENRKQVLNPLVEQFSPRYQITGYRIALRFVEPGEDGVWSDISGGNLVNPMPDAILSTYELQSLFFYQHLHRLGMISGSAEAFVQDYLRRFKTFCQKAETGEYRPDPAQTEAQRKAALDGWLAAHDLLAKDLPDDLRSYLCGAPAADYKSEALRWLDKKIEEEDRRRWLIKINRLPDRSELEAGKMASYLASDIIFLQPLNQEKKGKPNNDQYDDLQAAIALFGGRKEQLKMAFTELHLREKGHPQEHPFLFKINVDNCRGILDFYEEYLSQKNKMVALSARQSERGLARPGSHRSPVRLFFACRQTGETT